MNPNPLGLSCDVCGDEAFGVASSALGAVSFAYCRPCLAAGAEVYGMLVATIRECGGVEGVADWVIEMIGPTLERTGKTREEFDRAIAER